MQLSGTRAVAAIIGIGAICYGACLAIGNAQSQTPSAQATAAADSNELQRSVGVYGYNVAGKSGRARGEVIYYYKCWFCHNDYARASGSPAPSLKGIFSRANLVTGDPLNDETVAKQIRNGSAQMPAFGTALKNADIGDLVAYMHEGCCWQETKPPANPWYRATAQNSPAMPERGNLRGGPKGIVRTADGNLLEGIMVQLIAPNAVRTTVYSNADGRYEFPKLDKGLYTLRIAQPRDFQPYFHEGVAIEGATALVAFLIFMLGQIEPWWRVNQWILIYALGYGFVAGLSVYQSTVRQHARRSRALVAHPDMHDVSLAD